MTQPLLGAVDGLDETREEGQHPSKRHARLASAGSVAGALATLVCCTLPTALVLAGVTGVWLGQLTSFYVYQPYFVALTLGFLAYGFYTVYWRPKKACAPEMACARVGHGRFVKFSLWSASILLLVGIAFPYIALWWYAA